MDPWTSFLGEVRVLEIGDSGTSTVEVVALAPTVDLATVDQLYGQIVTIGSDRLREIHAQVTEHLLVEMALDNARRVHFGSLKSRHHIAAFPAALHPAYLPVGSNYRSPTKWFHVFAVGADVPKCVGAFAASLNVQDVVDLDYTYDDAREFLREYIAADKDIRKNPALDNAARSGNKSLQWSATALFDGTGMKFAGVVVPGGHVMTWWK